MGLNLAKQKYFTAVFCGALMLSFSYTADARVHDPKVDTVVQTRQSMSSGSTKNVGRNGQKKLTLNDLKPYPRLSYEQGSHSETQ